MWNGIAPNSQGQAWGEAVVQRLPEFFDQTDPALTANANSYLSGAPSIPLGDATPLRSYQGYNGQPNNWVVNSLNQNMGRRFKIVSFRWLNQNEL